MTYERSILGSAVLPAEPVQNGTAAARPSDMNRWLLVSIGIAAGIVVGRWLKRRHPSRNPMPWSELKVGPGFWAIIDERTTETLGYVVEMKGYYSAHTAKRVFIGAMPTLVSAAGLVYGRFWEKFEGADTLVGVQAPNPDYHFETMMPGITKVMIGTKEIGWAIDHDGVWEASSSIGKGYKMGFQDMESAAEWLVSDIEKKVEPEPKPEQEKGSLYEVFSPEREVTHKEEVKKSKKRLSKEKAKIARQELTDEELDKRIVITLYRSKIKGKTYTKDLSGKEREVAKQLLLPKSLTADEIAPKVKSTRNRVFDRAKALARDSRIFGVCGYRIVNVPTTREDSKGRKIMTFRQKKALVCKFAAFGPNGEVGFFAKGEHQLPEENPGYQEALPFRMRQYIVKERKPLYRSTAGRFVWSEWKEVSKHDTLTAALKATFIRHPAALHSDWQYGTNRVGRKHGHLVDPTRHGPGHHPAAVHPERTRLCLAGRPARAASLGTATATG